MAGVFTHNGDVVEGLPSIASQINYSNTSSGMQATQVQAAIDELNTNKQPKTDNNLTTTSKETTGAINELKSGLTNKQNSLDLEVVVSDLDEAGVGLCQANRNTVNTPKTGDFLVFTVHLTYDNYGFAIQLAVEYGLTINVYMRYKWATWAAWAKITTESYS